MILDYFKLAYLALKNRKLRSWLTILGILIGISAVISLISLGEGLRNTVTSQFKFLSADILAVQASGLQAGPPGQGVVKPLKEHYAQDIERISGVDIAIGRLIEDAQIQFNKRTDFTFAASVPDGKKRAAFERIVQLEPAHGRLLNDGDKDKVVLGHEYTKTSHFGTPITPRDTVLVNGKKFSVAGMLEKKGSFIIDHAIFMNEDDLKDLFTINDTYDIIAVKVNTIDEMPAVKQRIEHYLRKERDVDEGEEDFLVESPEQTIQDLESTLFAIQIFIYVIAGISIIVGGIGIANTMYTSVVERTKHIGIMKSIGARRSDIFTLFLIESGLLGLIGGLAGILIGLGLAYSLAALATTALNATIITVSATPPLLIGSLAFSFLIGSIFGIAPALAAARLQPVDALRRAT